MNKVSQYNNKQVGPNMFMKSVYYIGLKQQKHMINFPVLFAKQSWFFNLAITWKFN